jgi:hypothetical protein
VAKARLSLEAVSLEGGHVVPIVGQGRRLDGSGTQHLSHRRQRGGRGGIGSE